MIWRYNAPFIYDRIQIHGDFPTGFFHIDAPLKLEADRSARLVSIFLKAGNSEGWVDDGFFFLTKMIFL